MKLHKVTLYIVDFSELDDLELEDEIEFRLDGLTCLDNHKVVELGNFEDSHELNQNSVTAADFEKYFK